jgi:hypothetical protein
MLNQKLFNKAQIYRLNKKLSLRIITNFILKTHIIFF